MNKLILSTIILWITAGLSLHAQTVTTTPLTVTPSSKGIVITFHADGGNRGMMGLPSTAQVYAHTGVITSESTSASDWKHATDWNSPSANHLMTYAGPDTWTLTIPDINTFYGITDASETVTKLAFVFRDASGNRQGKTATGADVMVEVFPDGFPSSAPSPYPGGEPKMGATRSSDGGVTFCLAAPSKTNVVLVGSWNSYAITSSQVMNYQDTDGVRYFWTTVNGLDAGKDYLYYYIVDGSSQVGDPYANLVLDPYNDQYISSSVFPNLPAYPTSAVSGVPLAVYNSDINKYDWKVSGFKGVPQSDLIIYELLLRDFTGTEGRDYGDGTVKGAIDKLDYLKQLGVNAIELLPIMEFAGNNSWGYNTNFYMAPDKAYGTPADYRALIDGAHERGMAVILDIVFNQSDSFHPWYELYTRKDSPFYNGSAPHAYSVLNDWNQDFPLVQRQWRDALDYWMTEYRVDGFRFDLVKGLGDNSSYGTAYDAATNTYATPTDAGTNKYNPTRVARMKALHASMMKTNPDAYFINENLAGAEEENQMAADGETNWANVNYQACQFAMGYTDDSSLDRFYAPLDQRTWGSTVSYAESHDEERVAYKIRAYGVPAIKSDLNLQMLRLGSLAAQMLLTPGAHMIWQFEELGCEQTTKNGDGSNDTAPKRVNWNMLKSPARLGLHDTYEALCAIRATYPSMFREDVNTSVNLKSSTARTISLTKGDASIHLVVNPAVNTSATIPAPVDLSDPRYTLLAASYGVTPTVSAAGVTLPGSAFAVYGASLESDITEVSSSATNDAPVQYFNLQGIEIATPGPGIYIRRQGSEVTKVILK
ncbi:MAG: alpha-amylase family glycosyl hydrolase [Muribaculaceae bacterium]|nr:alpha-amylase family glycosyl hydrolase [Muribaculaceae bacterium]